MRNRREFIQYSATGIAALSLCKSLLALAAVPTLLSRTIPGTTESLPIVGLGNSTAFRNADIPLSRELIELFMERGGAYIDTSGSSRFTVAGLTRELKAQEKLFLGSADWMKRNLYRRIEVIFPVYNPELIAEITELINFQLNDNTKAVEVDKDMVNRKVDLSPDRPVRAQNDIYKWLKKKEERLGNNSD